MISTNKKVKNEIISQSQGLCGAGQKGRKEINNNKKDQCNNSIINEMNIKPRINVVTSNKKRA